MEVLISFLFTKRPNLLPHYGLRYEKLWSLLLVVLILFADSSDSQEGGIMRFDKYYVDARVADPSMFTVSCTATYYEFGQGVKMEDCTDRLINATFTERTLADSDSYKWKFAASVRLKMYWLSVSYPLSPRNRTIPMKLVRSSPQSIEPTSAVSGSYKQFLVFHRDNFWESLRVRCTCTDNQVDCSSFVRVSEGIRNHDSRGQIVSQCYINPPFGESGQMCNFYYYVGHEVVSKPLLHHFQYSRTNPSPPTGLTIRLIAKPTLSYMNALLSLVAIASRESMQSSATFECHEALSQRTVMSCTAAFEDYSAKCHINLPVAPGKVYVFTAHTISLFPENYRLENSTKVSETHIFLGPLKLQKLSETTSFTEYKFILNVILKPKGESTQSHLTALCYTEDGSLWGNVERKMYSLQNLQIDDSPTYELILNLTSPLFVPRDRYKLRITTLSCLTNCSTADVKLASPEHLDIGLTAPDKPLGPIKVSVMVEEATGSSSFLWIYWEASRITSHDNFNITLCRGRVSCETSVDYQIIPKRHTRSFEYSASFLISQGGYYYGQVQPVSRDVMGEGKSFKMRIELQGDSRAGNGGPNENEVDEDIRTRVEDDDDEGTAEVDEDENINTDDNADEDDNVDENSDEEDQATPGEIGEQAEIEREDTNSNANSAKPIANFLPLLLLFGCMLACHSKFNNQF